MKPILSIIMYLVLKTLSFSDCYRSTPIVSN